ncbi:hypothetical protein B0187_09745 [Haemophilus paracuniculus]|uniref:Uncharacterized protein n=1 Tax=Haemophilus paracuniculus TaxID=734 RepID=A0A1T0APV3_9PAST|nr:hypothetical protein [Haemophilus paracuniculus]OOR98073.1 hypothetical protein B0187_09745 [Haemophilus paracuniculus]
MKNLTKVVQRFISNKEITHRYHSFDLCYSHFRQTKEKLADNMPSKQQIEQSCYVLWGYLASWGMLRNSFLLECNPAYLKPLVQWIYQQDNAVWKLDVADYLDKKEEIIRLYKEVEDKVKPKEWKEDKSVSETLITKILLGVFAVTPAYDRFFRLTFTALAKSNKKKLGKFENSLAFIHQFYQDNQAEIDRLSQSIIVRDFDGKPMKYHYSKAKILDMYGFLASYEPTSSDE